MRVEFRPRILAPDEFPRRLRELAAPPERLYLIGELPSSRAVAIVGTRHPTDGGRRFARDLAASLAREGVAIVSGGALGIDTAAHEGALDAGGVTVVVAPAAFDTPYPSENASLFERVVREGGAYVTAYAPGTKAQQHHFFSRNAQLAALADALVVVESGLRGGARNAAKWARELSRPVCAVPGSPWEPRGQGCLAELALGAVLVTTARAVLDAAGYPAGASALLPFEPPGRSAPSPRLPQSCSADPERNAVILALAERPLTGDELCSLTGLSPGRLQAWLLTLTLEGIVVSCPSGRIQLRTY